MATEATKRCANIHPNHVFNLALAKADITEQCDLGAKVGYIHLIQLSLNYFVLKLQSFLLRSFTKFTILSALVTVFYVLAELL